MKILRRLGYTIATGALDSQLAVSAVAFFCNHPDRAVVTITPCTDRHWL